MQRAEVFFIFECKLLTYRQLWKCVIVYILLGNLTTNFGCKTKTQSHDKQNSCKLKIVAGQGGWRAVKLVFAILISSFIGLAWSSWIVFCLAQLRPAPGGCRRWGGGRRRRGWETGNIAGPRSQPGCKMTVLPGPASAAEWDSDKHFL